MCKDMEEKFIAIYEQTSSYKEYSTRTACEVKWKNYTKTSQVHKLFFFLKLAI